jgi:nucleotide-binding universal stress UspA family protein
MAQIVVGVDGSPSSKRALAWAVAEADLRKASLLAVHAWLVPIARDEIGVVSSLDEETFRALRHAAAATVETCLAETDAQALGLDARAVAVRGPAAAVLLDMAAHADLLVLGSRGRGGFKGLLLGSVSQQCSHHAPCPVVIVRDGAEAAEP